MKIFVLFFLIAFASFAQTEKRPKKLSPFQASIDKCLSGQVNVKDLLDDKKLYLEIVKNFTLQASETTFREVIFMRAGQKQKLHFEDGVVQIYKIDADENVTLISTENLMKAPKDDGMRYKTRSLETRLDEFLTGGEIKSDFMKTTEYRSKQLVLNLVWSDGAIKNLTAQFTSEKQKLECQKKDIADICECRAL